MNIYTSFEWEEITFVKLFCWIHRQWSVLIQCYSYVVITVEIDWSLKKNNNNIFDKSFSKNVLFFPSLSLALSLLSSIIYQQWKYLCLFPLYFWMEPLKRASPSFCHQCVYIKKKKRRERMSVPSEHSLFFFSRYDLSSAYFLFQFLLFDNMQEMNNCWLTTRNHDDYN